MTPYTPNAIYATSGPPPGWPEPQSPPIPPHGWCAPKRATRGPLIFAAVVQFLTAALIGFLGLFLLLLFIGYQSRDLAGIVLIGAFAAVTALHVALGIGVLKARRWAMITSVGISTLYIALTLALALPLIVARDAHGWEQGLTMGIPALTLLLSADILTVRHLKGRR